MKSDHLSLKMLMIFSPKVQIENTKQIKCNKSMAGGNINLHHVFIYEPWCVGGIKPFEVIQSIA